MRKTEMHTVECDTCHRRDRIPAVIQDTICAPWIASKPPRPMGCSGHLRGVPE